MTKLIDLINDVGKFGDVKLGIDRSPKNALVKLALEEVPELLQSKIDDPLELADICILAFDVAYLKGWDLGLAIERKMKINWERSWEIDSVTGTLKHIKEKTNEYQG